MSKCGKCCYGVMTGANSLFCSVQNCLCEEVLYCEDYEPIVKPKTNGDRIRAMTDEELAEWLCDIAGWLPMYEGKMHPILDWLREEVPNG